MRPEQAVGVLLAGGGSRRMGGGDKCLLELGGRPMLAHVIARAQPQVSALILSANGNPRGFAEFGLPVVADTVTGRAGPLAGVLAGMEWARAMRPRCQWLASFPTDAPFLPRDMVERLGAALEAEDADIACVRSGGRIHPVAALWPVRFAEALHSAMIDEGLRKVEAWATRHRVVEVEFDGGDADPLFNVNTPENLAEAERLLTRAG